MSNSRIFAKINNYQSLKNFQFFSIPTIFGEMKHRKCIIVIFNALIVLLMLSCESGKQVEKSGKDQLALEFKKIDSLYLSLDTAEAAKLVNSLKNEIKDSDIESLTSYYYYKALPFFNEMEVANKYADSALQLFAKLKVQLLYPNSYTKAVLLKTDVLIRYKQYEDALNYYFKIKPVLGQDTTSINYIKYLTKICDLYFKQRKYKESAQYNLQALALISKSKNLSEPNKFHFTQSCLNNGGFSFEMALMLDSAESLYLKGLEYLASDQVQKYIGKDQINTSKIVFLDNLGGLMAKKGKLPASEKLLEEAVAMNDGVQDPIKKTTYLKLAETYGRLGKLIAADSVLNVAERIINAETTDNYDLKLRLEKARSELAFLKQDNIAAYAHLKNYLALADSVDNVTLGFSQLDLELRFENMQDKQDLQTLEKTNDNKTAYLIAIGLFLLMLTPIILLVLKNTRQAKRAEKATVRHNLELEKTMKHLELRNKDYAKMMKVMAHDLKNPIGGMVGIANLLLEENRFLQEDKEMLQLIESSGENSIEMINQLLNSGLAIENEVLTKEKTNLQHLLRQCTELLQYKADEKKQKIVFISGGPVDILISKEKIWRVFNNLIVNAIKFSPLDSTITVKLERLDYSVKVSVIDQGIGVPKEDRDKIFEMFTSAKRPGTAGEQPFGIGLSISKQIIESHDGKIWLEENPLGGTIFFVEIPFGKKTKSKKSA